MGELDRKLLLKSRLQIGQVYCDWAMAMPNKVMCSRGEKRIELCTKAWDTFCSVLFEKKQYIRDRFVVESDEIILKNTWKRAIKPGMLLSTIIKVECIRKYDAMKDSEKLIANRKVWERHMKQLMAEETGRRKIALSELHQRRDKKRISSFFSSSPVGLILPLVLHSYSSN